ncbi:hypothetical protein DFJ63DRAFT_334153 [Scheffersomyces coipomensis]|uniref:uncharacterized protein n=1 Tax=Scheffersomyces coipomensis TaxID=1788519 RepID=UPI00315D6786
MTTKFPKAPPKPEDVLSDPKLLSKVDERVSLDQKANSWIFESDDNIEYEYNYNTKKWDIRQDNISITKRKRDDHDDEKEEDVDDDELENKLHIKEFKKQKMQKVKDEISKLKQEMKQSSSEEATTTNAIFVYNLPTDITLSELDEIFGKYGLISEDYNTGEKRIKMYNDESNKFKGEALIFYHNKKSVPLAIDMLDGTSVRSDTRITIKVEPAKFTDSGSKKSKITERPSKEQQKFIKSKESLNKKLTDWDEFDSSDAKVDKSKSKLFSRIVVVENMFRVDELKADPVIELDLKEDIQDECNKLGIGEDISQIQVYDVSGTITIKFKKPNSSDICIKSLDGRFFDGLKLKASIFSGQKFEKTHNEIEEEGERLDKFSASIDS